MELNSTPWVEKYRPTNLNNIIFDDYNKIIVNNIINNNYFPNLLLYGPAGTGKTTTIINLVKKYQEINNETNSGLIIHLNASDDRGIDIIRNQINQFVNSNVLFKKGLKFVILDEVDYMTKNAQTALKYLLYSYNTNVRFCLICNYITKIDSSLKNELIKLKFNQLPKEHIYKYLKNIIKTEKVKFEDEYVMNIIRLYESDIRSMINHIQGNIIIKDKIIQYNIFEKLEYNLIMSDPSITEKLLDKISIEYNKNIKDVIKEYFDFIISYKKNNITTELLTFMEYIIHFKELDMNYLKKYFIYFLNNYYSEKDLSN